MTVKLSPHKVRKILRGYFRGLPQTKLAQEAGVDQSSISHYATRFRETNATYSLSAAGKEFGVENEVDTLRTLSVEMYKAGLTVADAQQGVAIIKDLLQMNVEPEQHALLIRVCKEVKDPAFVKAAIELITIEDKTKMDFHQTIERLEKVSTQLPILEDRLEDREAKLRSVNYSINERKQNLENLNKKLIQSRNESEKTIREREMTLSRKMDQSNIRENEINEVAKLKRNLAKQGLDIPTLVKLAKEFKK